MSALGHKRTCALHQLMSALPPKATFAVHYPMSAFGQKPTVGLEFPRRAVSGIYSSARRANGEECVGKRAQPLGSSFRMWHECQPNVLIQPAMARPISSGESSWT